jgi:hypothetical protein
MDSAPTTEMTKEELLAIIKKLQEDKKTESLPNPDLTTDKGIEAYNKQVHEKDQQRVEEVKNNIEENVVRNPSELFTVSANDKAIVTGTRDRTIDPKSVFINTNPAGDKPATATEPKVPSITNVPTTIEQSASVRRQLVELQTLNNSPFSSIDNPSLATTYAEFYSLLTSNERQLARPSLIEYSKTMPHFLRLVLSPPETLCRTDDSEIRQPYPLPELDSMGLTVKNTVMTGHIIIDCNVPGCEFVVDPRSPKLFDCPSFEYSTVANYLSAANSSNTGAATGTAELFMTLAKLFVLSERIGRTHLLATTYTPESLKTITDRLISLEPDAIEITNPCILNTEFETCYGGRFTYWPLNSRYTTSLPVDKLETYPHYIPELFRNYQLAWVHTAMEEIYPVEEYSYGVVQGSAQTENNVKVMEYLRCGTDLAMTNMMRLYRTNLANHQMNYDDFSRFCFSLLLHQNDFTANSGSLQFPFYGVKRLSTPTISAGHMPNYLPFDAARRFAFKLVDSNIDKITSRVHGAVSWLTPLLAKFPMLTIDNTTSKLNDTSINPAAMTVNVLQQAISATTLTPTDTDIATMMAISLEGINAITNISMTYSNQINYSGHTFIHELLGLIVAKNMYINFWMFNQAAYYALAHKLCRTYFSLLYVPWFQANGYGKDANNNILRQLPQSRGDSGKIVWAMETAPFKNALMEKVRKAILLSTNVSKKMSVGATVDEASDYRISSRDVRLPGILIYGTNTDYENLPMYAHLMPLLELYGSYCGSNYLTAATKINTTSVNLMTQLLKNTLPRFAIWFHSVYCVAYAATAKSPMYWRSDYGMTDDYYFSVPGIIDAKGGGADRLHQLAVLNVAEGMVSTALTKTCMSIFYNANTPNPIVNTSKIISTDDMKTFEYLFSTASQIVNMYKYLNEVEDRYRAAMPAHIIPYFRSGDAFRQFPALHQMLQDMNTLNPTVNVFAFLLRLFESAIDDTNDKLKMADPLLGKLLPDIRYTAPCPTLILDGVAQRATTIASVDMIPNYQKDTYAILLKYMFHEDFGLKRLYIGSLTGRRTFDGNITPSTVLGDIRFEIAVSETKTLTVDMQTGNSETKLAVILIDLATQNRQTYLVSSYADFLEKVSSLLHLPYGVPVMQYTWDEKVVLTTNQMGFLTDAIMAGSLIAKRKVGGHFVVYNYISSERCPTATPYPLYAQAASLEALYRYDNTFRTNVNKTPRIEMANSLLIPDTDNSVVLAGLHYTTRTTKTQIHTELMLPDVVGTQMCIQKYKGNAIEVDDYPYLLCATLPVLYHPVLTRVPIAFFVTHRV